MFLALLHGEYILGAMMVAGVLALIAALAVALWWWRHTSRSPFVLSGCYLLIASSACALYAFDAGNFLWFTLSFALTLPWSFLLVLNSPLVESEEQFAGLLFAAAVLNALLIYAAAFIAVRQAKGAPAG